MYLSLQPVFYYRTPLVYRTVVSTIEYDGSSPGDYDELVGSEHDHTHQIVDAKTAADALEGAVLTITILFYFFITHTTTFT